MSRFPMTATVAGPAPVEPSPVIRRVYRFYLFKRDEIWALPATQQKRTMKPILHHLSRMRAMYCL